MQPEGGQEEGGKGVKEGLGCDCEQFREWGGARGELIMQQQNGRDLEGGGGVK